MNDHVPLRVAIHRGQSNIMAAQTVIRPKLFTAETHIGIARGGSARRVSLLPVCFRLGKQAQSRAREKQNESHEDAAIQCCYHVTLWLRNPWPSERTERSCCAHRLAYPIHTRLSLRCWGLASN